MYTELIYNDLVKAGGDKWKTVCKIERRDDKSDFSGQKERLSIVRQERLSHARRSHQIR